ncbi:hypothetical protein JKP88DRAFT_246432 [Tribonema minus]|uniref:Uncharacterized protein n=1 Tax=Tribonema minus TaxID=303371 RepID=A0A835YUI2_9STRA|nr:hypothetical protein JKP88DRAFT_246432 [Tribonema minus]
MKLVRALRKMLHHEAAKDVNDIGFHVAQGITSNEDDGPGGTQQGSDSGNATQDPNEQLQQQRSSDHATVQHPQSQKDAPSLQLGRDVCHGALEVVMQEHIAEQLAKDVATAGWSAVYQRLTGPSLPETIAISALAAAAAATGWHIASIFIAGTLEDLYGTCCPPGSSTGRSIGCRMLVVGFGLLAAVGGGGGVLLRWRRRKATSVDSDSESGASPEGAFGGQNGAAKGTAGAF